jgi:hypothetical protein
MTRRFGLLAVALLVAIPAAAQAPKGWKFRADKSTSASDPDAPGDIKMQQMGPGFHATNPTAAVFWSPDSVARGAYTLKGTFHLMKPSGHVNYYGLVFGGDALDGPTQNYLYFLVGQNGTFIVKHRAGDATVHDVVGRTPNAAVKQPGAEGSSANNLEVRVAADKIDYVINGTVVHTTPKAGMTAKTDGIYGVRINHQLEVHVEKFGVTKQ